MRGIRFTSVIGGALLGATLALLFDPDRGRRRRALARDKMGRIARVSLRGLSRAPRGLVGPARGALHTARRRAPWHETPAPPDTHEYVKHRVESELGRDPSVPLGAVNVDAVDGVVRVRGTVADEATARRIVERAASVAEVRAVVSLLRTPDGVAVGGAAGDLDLVHGKPRAAVHGADVRRRLMERWPALTDADIRAGDGHIGSLTSLIVERTGEHEADVRTALDDILATAV